MFIQQPIRYAFYPEGPNAPYILAIPNVVDGDYLVEFRLLSSEDRILASDPILANDYPEMRSVFSDLIDGFLSKRQAEMFLEHLFSKIYIEPLVNDHRVSVFCGAFPNYFSTSRMSFSDESRIQKLLV